MQKIEFDILTQRARAKGYIESARNLLHIGKRELTDTLDYSLEDNLKTNNSKFVHEKTDVINRSLDVLSRHINLSDWFDL